MASTITYNAYDLQTSNIITEKVLHTSAPDNDLSTEQKMRRSGSYLMSNYWVRKVITLTGHILGSSVSDLDSRIDALKQNLVGENLNLDIGYSGGTRRYRATTRRVDIEREHFHTNWCPFMIEFVCADAFGKATSPTSVTQEDNTTSPFSKTFTITGSVGPYPIITLDFTSGSNVSVIVITNTTTGDSITITRGFADAESLVVDCDGMTVKVDGTEVDFSGVFPEFVVGSNTLQVTVTGTPFDIDLDITYTLLYL